MSNNQFWDTFVTLIGLDPNAPKFSWSTLPIQVVPMNMNNLPAYFDYGGQLITNPGGNEASVSVTIISNADGTLDTPVFISVDLAIYKFTFDPKRDFTDVGTHSVVVKLELGGSISTYVLTVSVTNTQPVFDL